MLSVGAVATVVDRHVFYNNSVYDGRRAEADAGDDAAIAPDKAALLPGQAPSFANVTSYVRGINGLMLDVAGLPAATVPGTADFSFSAGNNNDPALWAAAPPPADVSIRRGTGANGSDRITITWPDGAIVDRWLRVTFNAAARTRLAAPDVFYFGNLVGETGNDAAPVELKVNAQDLADVKGALITPSPLAGRYDFNRDGRVNALDIAALKAHLNRPLVLFTPPAAAALRAEDSISDLLR